MRGDPTEGKPRGVSEGRAGRHGAGATANLLRRHGGARDSRFGIDVTTAARGGEGGPNVG